MAESKSAALPLGYTPPGRYGGPWLVLCGNSPCRGKRRRTVQQEAFTARGALAVRECSLEPTREKHDVEHHRNRIENERRREVCKDQREHERPQEREGSPKRGTHAERQCLADLLAIPR